MRAGEARDHLIGNRCVDEWVEFNQHCCLAQPGSEVGAQQLALAALAVAYNERATLHDFVQGRHVALAEDRQSVAHAVGERELGAQLALAAVGLERVYGCPRHGAG